jgi:glyoxylase-like metal-dependent hydrolase (beta-lactamase superfamily II)
MADPRKRLEGNAAGEFYVDSSCIDCDQCRQIAPRIFGAEGDFSVVRRQPGSVQEVLRAEMSLVTCPTGSIGTASKHDLTSAVSSFPERIDANVHFCGFASEDSFGGSSYLIVRPGGNVLVDSPRFTERLVQRIEEMGGVRWMFLTHLDDVADHAKFRERFGCERVMHEADAEFEVERPVRGSDPVPLADDLLVIPTPGHTAGHLALLHAGSHLFTGDHLWWDPHAGRLEASRRYCWHSWEEQTRSMKRLLGYSFEWVLPGHGARHRAPSGEMQRLLGALVRRM